MEVLQERFGEVRFRDTPSWQPWETTDVAAAWQPQRSGPQPAPLSQTQFHLASPKFHLNTASSRTQDALQVEALEQSSSLGGLVKCPEEVTEGTMTEEDIGAIGAQGQMPGPGGPQPAKRGLDPGAPGPCWPDRVPQGPTGFWPQQVM